MDNESNEGNGEFFIIDESNASDDEVELLFSHQKHQRNYKHTARLSGKSSPPLLLAFSTTPGRPSPVSSPVSRVNLVDLEEEEDSDQPIEEWMILGGEEQTGDSTIQLNLSYLNNSEEDSGDEDPVMKSKKDTWTVSEKDKSLHLRYWLPGKSQICNNCNREGHLARSCYYHKKRPVCILCGIMGHIQWDCPSRPCPSCGLPSHGSRPCERPPVRDQHCQRCGVVGHLSDTCPDLWRQYHLTIRLEVPLRPSTVHTLQNKKCLHYCYNCSKQGHYGYECPKRISGTFSSLPYVCHYDTIDDILNPHAGDHSGTKELTRSGSLLLSNQNTPSQECDEENQSVKERSRMKQESHNQTARKKTWPERRRERREVKRLRREAQARREGGLFGKSLRSYEEEDVPSDPFKSPLLNNWKTPPPPQNNKRRDEVGGRRSRKSREAERWRKRGGLKHGDLYPYVDIDIRSEKLISPKQRVRHRRK